MKLLRKTSNLVFNRISYYTTQQFPYVDELYRKNYIKYPTQSKVAVTHDYSFHGEERLLTLAERLKEFKDSSDELVNDIGKKVFYSKLRELKENCELEGKKSKENKSLIQAARDLKLKVPIDKINYQTKQIKSFRDVLKIANHYNINKDLFHRSFFNPSIDLKVQYATSDKKTVDIYYGNKLSAKSAQNQPTFSWEDVLEIVKEETVYHSLMLVNLDGNFEDSTKDVLLWFKGNIKNNDYSSGEELMSYMQPLPMKNTGWHRCAYVLFEHKQPISFKLSTHQTNAKSVLGERSFKAADFHSNYKNDLTPVGLCFFQTEWDLSVKDYFHNKLNIEEPIYQFDFGAKFVPRFEKYPKGQVFNWYLNEYTDKKELNEDVMKQYLKQLSPFETYPEPSKYPILDVEHVRPKWYKYELESIRKRKHQYSIIPFKFSHDHNRVKEALKHLPYQQQK